LALRWSLLPLVDVSLNPAGAAPTLDLREQTHGNEKRDDRSKTQGWTHAGTIARS
jgi:hypothetical protein